MLAEPVNNIKGIGDRAAADFAKMKIFTHKDLLEHFPLRYEHYPYPVPVEECHPAKTAALQFILNNEIKQTRTGNGCYVRMNVNGRILMLLWFHNPYLRHMLHLKQEYIFLGSIVEKEDGSYIMTSPVFFTPEQYIQLQGTYDPVYRQTKNLRTTKIQKAIGEIKEDINLLEDQVPEDVQQHFDLMPYKDAVRTLHFPGSREDIEAAKRSICISELYGYLSEVHKRKKRGKTVYRTGIFQPLRIPFSLTEGQQNVWDDIMNDLNSGIQMRRLIQGDVGSGKSIIAFLAMAAIAQNGYQSVLLAPTEIYAKMLWRGFNVLVYIVFFFTS